MEECEPQDALLQILRVIEELTNIADLDALLDRVLLEARRLTRADAGSIYLIADDALHFCYIHNDTLFKSYSSHKHLYAKNVLAINPNSLAGYVASTGEPLVIDDAYQIPAAMPFCFNYFFDSQTGYRTGAILAVPLKTGKDKVVGVVQLLNPLDDQNRPTHFTPRDRTVLTYFANNAAAAIERARLTREIILRMIKMCELHDPEETGPHVCRVAAYAAEIYHRWAQARGLPEGEIKKTKDSIRIAAMLHDLGKIAISDLIIKKPGKLTPAEFRSMQYHTIYGARLFANPASALDVMSAEIALNHHENWDGSGYPGKIPDLSWGEPELGPGKKAEEIPLAARIVALADVYDALVSKRSYKEPFSQEEALEYIRERSGTQFDPEVVLAFLDIQEVIVAIKEKYLEQPDFSPLTW